MDLTREGIPVSPLPHTTVSPLAQPVFARPPPSGDRLNAVHRLAGAARRARKSVSHIMKNGGMKV